MFLYKNYYDQSIFKNLLVKIKILYSTLINSKADIYKYQNINIDFF